MVRFSVSSSRGVLNQKAKFDPVNLKITGQSPNSNFSQKFWKKLWQKNNYYYKFLFGFYRNCFTETLTVSNEIMMATDNGKCSVSSIRTFLSIWHCWQWCFDKKTCWFSWTVCFWIQIQFGPTLVTKVSLYLQGTVSEPNRFWSTHSL